VRLGDDLSAVVCAAYGQAPREAENVSLYEPRNFYTSPSVRGVPSSKNSERLPHKIHNFVARVSRGNSERFALEISTQNQACFGDGKATRNRGVFDVETRVPRGKSVARMAPMRPPVPSTGLTLPARRAHQQVRKPNLLVVT
jgi:hypothetical protein